MREGAVLGIDVGFSPTRRSSAVCRLEWDAHGISWEIDRFQATLQERERVITAVAGQGRLEAAAFDGPLRTGFTVIGSYRAAERMLTRRLQPKIGKPGPSSAPVGKALNDAANACAKVVMQHCKLADATHGVRIDKLAVVEAFPSSFLGLLIEDPAYVPVRRSDRSDRYFEHLVDSGGLTDLIARLLPGRSLNGRLADVTNHDDRAALICAVTALSVAAGEFTAVGDSQGWIILPPAWAIQSWGLRDLEANLAEETTGQFYRTGDWGGD